MRALFTKYGGNLGETGSVSFMFSRVGEISYPASKGSADAILEAAIEAGADDTASDENGHVITCSFENIGEVSASLAKKTGHGYTLMGGIRHLAKSINSPDNGEAGRAARQAWSMEIQGSAAEMTKLAMSRLWTSGAYFKYDARFIAPVHDEIVDSVSAEDAVEFIKLKHWCMTQPYGGMGVPILGSISIGPDYHKQIECGDWFIEDRIRTAINDIFTKKEASV